MAAGHFLDEVVGVAHDLVKRKKAVSLAVRFGSQYGRPQLVAQCLGTAQQSDAGRQYLADVTIATRRDGVGGELLELGREKRTIHD